MTVIAFAEIFPGRGGGEVWGEKGDSLTVNRTRMFLTQTNNDQDTDVEVLAFASIPKAGDSHHRDARARVIGRSAKQMSQGPRWWKVTCKYTSKLTAAQKEELDNPQPNPVDRRVHVNWSVQRYEKVIERDRDGFPIQNRAFDPPDPPPTVPKGNIIASITGNVLNLEPWILEDYPFSVNDADFTLKGFPIKKGKAMLTDVKITDQQWEGVYPYFGVELQVEISTRKQGHEYWMANQGVHQLDRDDREKTDCVIVDKNKKVVPVRSPVMLHIDDGYQLTTTEIQDIIDAGTQEDDFYIKYPVVDEKDWTKLQLPA